MFIKWAKEYGLCVNTEKRIIDGRPQWAKIINDKIIYIIGDNRKELKEQEMPKLLIDKSESTRNDMPEDDPVDIVEITSKDTSIIINEIDDGLNKKIIKDIPPIENMPDKSILKTKNMTQTALSKIKNNEK